MDNSSNIQENVPVAVLKGVKRRKLDYAMDLVYDANTNVVYIHNNGIYGNTVTPYYVVNEEGKAEK